ncbi:hypothetical protein HPB51_028967 [Rhipicephalus microplus]|uniref:Uncharacterized protein n=1 Tax=Rhipicephalus microplus TaxID=6941 RepID=A0A9J6CVK4_RHIMP|nr:hypothetical protein HPB51_028967 [Rhipicephalus microplus]
MSFSSPGQGHIPWLASLQVKDCPLDTLLRSGDSYVPVALVPTNGGFIPMKNPKVIQVELQKASSLFEKITKVRQFGRGSILCCSADQDCVRELLNRSEFAAQPCKQSRRFLLLIFIIFSDHIRMLLQDIGRNVQACHAHFAMKKAAVQTNPAKTTTGQCGLEPKKKKKKECCMDGCVDALFSDHIRMLLYDIDRNVQACHAHFAMKKAAVQTNPARRRPANCWPAMFASLHMVAATVLRETICAAENVDRKATRLVAEHQPPCPCGQREQAFTKPTWHTGQCGCISCILLLTVNYSRSATQANLTALRQTDTSPSSARELVGTGAGNAAADSVGESHHYGILQKHLQSVK